MVVDLITDPHCLAMGFSETESAIALQSLASPQVGVGEPLLSWASACHQLPG